MEIVELQVANSVMVFLFQGATIKAEESTGRILIARVMHGGAADRSGLISVGDEVRVYRVAQKNDKNLLLT